MVPPPYYQGGPYMPAGSPSFGYPSSGNFTPTSTPSAPFKAPDLVPEDSYGRPNYPPLNSKLVRHLT